MSNGLAGQGSIRNFLRGLPFVFQRGRSEGLDATYHFTFTGHEELKATVVIQNKTLQVSEGHNGTANLRLIADSQTWLRFLRKGSQSCLGSTAPEDPHQRFTPALAGLRPLLPVVAIGVANEASEGTLPGTAFTSSYSIPFHSNRPARKTRATVLVT